VECLDRLRPLYDAARERAAEASGADPARGVGLGCFWFGPGKSKPDESEAHAQLLDDGTLRIHMAAADIGQGSDTVFAQIAAQELGLAFADVDLVSTDTGSCPDGGYSSGSRQTYLSGCAVQLAAGALGVALIEAAAARLGVDAADLYCSGGAVHSRRSDTPWVSFADLAATGFAGRRFVGKRTADITAVDAETGQGTPYETYSFGVQMAEVAVDRVTGETKVERVTAVHDSGTPINMLTLEGQIEGGVAQGVGYALFEKYVRDETLNFNTYRVPRVKDVPEVVTIMVQVPRPGGPHGAAAVAECALVPTAPAIVNAIADATGVRVRDLPVAKEALQKG
jgi:CO/xanthine dehydrogenase Mo-binding subunit